MLTKKFRTNLANQTRGSVGGRLVYGSGQIPGGNVDLSPTLPVLTDEMDDHHLSSAKSII